MVRSDRSTRPQLGALYGSASRDLQDHFDSRRLADRLVDVTVHDELDAGDVELIGEQSTMWIATVDEDGWPDVSYKGGVPGFVEVVSPTELRIPSYDGNGMFRSLGNIAATGRVALLFLDAAQRRRLRVHGSAVVSTDPADVARHEGAQAVVVVTVGRAFPNCGRYIHRGEEISPYVPRPGHEPPVPGWKQMPQFSDVLPGAGSTPPEG
jgi:predicted pyridoxine 5'-phosphate oxidase superfamily flavin-nucleotide-binding protein